MRGIGILARDALERVERKVLPGRGLPSKSAFGKRPRRVAFDRRELAQRDPLARGRIGGERFRKTHIAPLGRQAKARVPIGARKLALREERNEERLACVGRRLSGQPERLRRG